MEYVHLNLQSVDSTNSWAKKRLQEFDRSQTTVVIADEQTAGRGQFGRSWIAPKGEALLISFCFFSTQDPLTLARLMAETLCETLAHFGLHGTIKWPNDVLVDGKKIAGILCETKPVDDLTGVVIGVGLNTNIPPEFLASIDQPATSILAETGKRVSRAEILQRIQRNWSASMSGTTLISG